MTDPGLTTPEGDEPFLELTDVSRVYGDEVKVYALREVSLRIMPGDFIPFAEESGQIVPMGRWTLMEVADQLTRWHALGFEGEIAVNLSSRQFVEGDLAAEVRATLRLLGVGPRR